MLDFYRVKIFRHIEYVIIDKIGHFVLVKMSIYRKSKHGTMRR